MGGLGNKTKGILLRLHTHGELVDPEEIVYKEQDFKRVIDIMFDELYEHIAHGNNEHKKWLLNEINKFKHTLFEF